MTYEEAIKRIKNHNEIHQRKEEGFAFHISEALDMAVKALEKQIPKIVKRVGVFEVAKCNCGSYVDLSDNFCRKCGQALKWGD